VGIIGYNPTTIKEATMAVRVLIKRKVPQEKAKDMIQLFKQMRMQATDQDGYVSGETLKSLDVPDEFLVISTWQSPDAWQQWLNSRKRQEIQKKIDDLLGGKTTYEMYHYGIKE
jgi:heme-degrading monooxygenase HmoA